MTALAITESRLVEFRPALNSFANALCGDAIQAEDLVQETLLKAWAAREQYCEDNCKAWLFTILRNHYYSELRRRKLERSDPDGALAAHLHEQAHCDEPLEVRDVLRAVSRLPVDQRIAMVLVCSDGLSYEEAARQCHCAGALSKVKWRVRVKNWQMVTCSNCSISIN